MHIGIDASRYHNTAQKTGVEVYSANLIPGLVEQALEDNHEITLYTPKPLEDFAKDLQSVLPMKRFWSLIRLASHFTRKELHPDVFFVPSHILPPIAPSNSVVTIHDIAFRKFPKTYTRTQRILLNYSVTHAKKSKARILTVSTSTKKDLMELYHIPETQITVTPLGFQARPTEQTTTIQKDLGLETTSYIVYLGRIEHKKNCAHLIEEFLNAHLPNTTLVLIGKHGPQGEAIQQQYKHHPNILFTGFLSEADTSTLLQEAEFLCLPSLYEGFGMPILEAYHHGIPVITSTTSSMPEVAGPGALLVDPLQKGALQSAIVTLHKDAHLREELAAKGKQHSKYFTWERTIQQTYDVLTSPPHIPQSSS